MKRIFTLILFFLVFSSVQSFSQSCRILGCADNYGTLTADETLPNNTSGFLGGCFTAPTPIKQVFWQFFFSPAGGVYKQAFTPIGTNNLDLDYVVYDLGPTDPGTLACSSINPDGNGWNQIICNNDASFDIATGPGQPAPYGNVLMTTAMHYYALAIVFYQSGPGPYSFTVGTPTIDAGGGDIPLSSASCLPITLPVNLSLFNAKVNNCSVNLDWIALSEVNFKSYEVQYSTNGTIFNTIETKPFNGVNRVYSFQHNSALQGNAYYRLKMIDNDGSVGYSKTVSVKFDCENNQSFIYPNPVKDKLSIQITSAAGIETRASLFDNNGKLVYHGRLNNGYNTIDMTGFAKGLYLLTIKNNIETKTIKIIK